MEGTTYTELAPRQRRITWAELEGLADLLVARHLGPMARERPFDLLLGVARGGMIPACLVAQRLDIRAVLLTSAVYYTGIDTRLEAPIIAHFPPDEVLRDRRLLIVDDVWDSGETLVAVRARARAVAGCTVATAVLHHKPGRSAYPLDGPDAWAERTEDWLRYPWDPGLPAGA